jgi:elongation factor G
VVGNYDEEIGDMFLNEQEVSSEKLKAAIRKIVISDKFFGKVVPVLVGASFRNVGVQPLMDAIIDYLPAPNER